MEAPRARAQLSSTSNTPAVGKVRVVAGAERGGDLGAVRLVADGDDRVAGALDRGEHVVGASRPARAARRSRSSAPVAFAIAAAVSRARSSGLASTSSGSTGASRSPSSRACSRPRALSGRSASGSPGSEWAWRTRKRRTRDRFTDMRSFRYVLADVFTDRPLAGNQLAVFTDARDLDEVTMQELALELGLSRDASSSCRRARAARCGSGSSRRATRSPSPGIRASAPRSCSARRSSWA